MIAFAPGVARAETLVHLTLATDAVQRGLSETGGDPSLALGLDWAGERWFAGTRLSNSRLPPPVNPRHLRGQTVAAYVGYHWPLSAAWSAQGLATRYEFTGDQRGVDGYGEWSLSVSNEHVGMDLALAPDAWGASGLTRYVSVFGQHPLNRWSERVVLDAAVGYADAERSLNWTYRYLELGLSYQGAGWFADARVHLLDDERINRSRWSRAQSRLVLSLGFQF